MKRRILASLLTLVMMLSLLPTAALASGNDGVEPSPTTTLRMKVGEAKTVSFDSGMEDLSSSSASPKNASVTVSSNFAVAGAPVTDAAVPDGYYYISDARKTLGDTTYLSDTLAQYTWGSVDKNDSANDGRKTVDWITYVNQEQAAIYQVIANGDETTSLKCVGTDKYLSSKYDKLQTATIYQYGGDDKEPAPFQIASMAFSENQSDSCFTLKRVETETERRGSGYTLSIPTADGGKPVCVNSLGGYSRAVLYQTSIETDGSPMQFYKVGYTTTVTVRATNVGSETITIGGQTINIIVSDDNSFQDVYVGAGQSTEVQVTSTSKYNDAVLRDDNALKVIAVNSNVAVIGDAVSSDPFTPGTYVIQDQRTNNPNIVPANRYYTDQIVPIESFAGRNVITESSLDNAGLYEFIANSDGSTYAVKTGDNYLQTTGFTMDANGAYGLISSASWTANKSESAVQLVPGPDGTVGLYTKDTKDQNAMMASWGGGQFSMWANYSSPSADSGSALLLYPASVTTTLKVTGQTVGNYEVVFEDTVLRIHVVDPVRVPVMGSVTVPCSGASASSSIDLGTLSGLVKCTAGDGEVTFTNDDASGLKVGDIHTGTVMIGKAAFSVSVGIDEKIDMAQGSTKNIAYKDGSPVVSGGLTAATKTEDKAVLVTDIADIQDGGEYLIAGMRVQTVAGSEEINWNPGSQGVHGLNKLAGTPVGNDTGSFDLTGYDAARVRFEKVGENTYNLYNVSAGKYLTGSTYNLGLTARKSEASAMTVTTRLATTYGAGLVSIGTGSYEIGDWGGYWSDGFTMISKGSDGTELKLYAAVDSIAAITADQTGVGYVTVGGKTYQVNVFSQVNAAAELKGTLYPTVSAAVKDAKAGDTINLKNTSDTSTETVEIPVGVAVKYGRTKTFADAYYQVKNGDDVVAEIPVQSENGKAVLFLPSSAPEVETLTAENLNLGEAKLNIENGQATATLVAGEVTLTKTFTVAKAGNISAIFISGLKEENDNTKDADINWINATKSNVGANGQLAKVKADGTVAVDIGVKKMKGRGNTSWGAAVDGNAATDKKPYNITLDKKATLIDGLNYKEKKWCLIANNYADFSGVNNYMAYTMYQEIGGNSAMHIEPVDLYVDGEYRGIYMVTDKVEIGTNRVNVPKSDYSTAEGTAESQAKVIVDNYDTHFDTNADVKYWQSATYGATTFAAAADEALKAGVLAYAYASEQRQDKLNGGYVLEVSHQYTDEAGWFITKHGVMISFKEPERPTQAQVQAAAIYVQQFEDALYSTTGYNSLGKHYSDYLDIESLAKTYLLSCFTGQNDFLDCSDYLNLKPTYDESGKITGGKLMGGPAWDYDVSNYATNRLYADKSSTNVNGNQAWISQLLKHGDFTDALYKLKTGAFADAVASMKGKVETYGKNVAASLAMDQLMWNRTMSAQQQYDTQKANFLKRANTTWDAVWNDAALKGVSIAVNEGTGEIVATANTTGNAAYKWFKLNGDKVTATECAGATNAVFTPSEAGTYYVAVTGTAMNGKDVPETMISAAVESEGHSYSGEWSSDENNHWHDCTVEGHTDKKDSAAHTWNDGVVTTEATCTTAGVKTYTCTVCNATKKETIPVKEHDWSNHDGICKVCKTPCGETHQPGTTCPVCHKYTSYPYVPGAPTYPATAPAAPNGTVTVSPANASKGANVTVTVKPNEGYELGSLAVKDANGNVLPLTDLGNGKFGFVMPASKVSVEAEFVKSAVSTGFADVPANAFFADAVKWAVENGVTNGLTETMFGPYEPCTRGQIITFLWRAAGSPEPKTAVSFADVPAGSYYAKAVAWAIENGITNGLTETTFAPDATCTRGQGVTFLYRALKGSAGATSSFADVPANAFYADAVGWAVSGKVTDGTSNTTFSPDDNCTRGQIVTFLYRAYQGK